jgi:predicted enzyme related to lactoylglutathione lyase
MCLSAKLEGVVKMKQHEKLNYVEFAARDLAATKSFFSSVFGWNFVDYGSEYSSFSNQGLNGGFFKADACSQTKTGGALLVFYSSDIDATLDKILKNGGQLSRPIFEFPGGCRFHFLEPSGNEFAVWSEA